MNHHFIMKLELIHSEGDQRDGTQAARQID